MGLSDAFHYCFTELADKRVNHWPLLSSPYFLPGILFSYLYFVLKCGPRYMKDRPPYNLKTFIRFYNVFQVIANILIVSGMTDGFKFSKISYDCTPLTYDTDPYSMKMASSLWYLLVLKIIDLAETVIFVLRKNQHQVTFLHLYHHVSTVLIGWICIKYVAGSTTLISPLVNSMVHVVMYTYYFLSTFQGEFKKTLHKFKPFITLIQLVQFVILMAHTAQGLMPSCNVVPLPIVLIFMGNLLMNFFLFLNFYVQNYVKRKNDERISEKTKLK